MLLFTLRLKVDVAAPVTVTRPNDRIRRQSPLCRQQVVSFELLNENRKKFGISYHCLIRTIESPPPELHSGWELVKTSLTYWILIISAKLSINSIK
jgi:hypothetical protein